MKGTLRLVSAIVVLLLIATAFSPRFAGSEWRIPIIGVSLFICGVNFGVALANKSEVASARE